MLLHIVSIRDRAANVFGVPMFMSSIGAAIRSFGDEINRTGDQNNIMNRHPDDFDMYELGVYDDGTAKFEMLESPRQIAVGKDLVK